MELEVLTEWVIIPPLPEGGGGYTVLPLSIRWCWWQKSDIWSQASYRYPISWEAFLNPSDSYFLFADFVDFYTHWTYFLYMPIFRRIFLSNYWWQKSDIAITLSLRPSVCPSIHTFVTDISASTGRNDFIFDIWLWHGNLYRVSPFQVYHTSTSCLQCDLEFFMFAVMKTFVTVISVSTGRNDFIFEIWLWHGDLYRVSPFQVYRTSTSCLPCDLQMNEWGYS